MPPAGELSDREIRSRKETLFDMGRPDGPAEARRPFAEVLRETPPTPLSTGVKAALVAAGVVVALLFLLSLWAMLNPRRKPKAATSFRPTRVGRPATIAPSLDVARTPIAPAAA